MRVLCLTLLLVAAVYGRALHKLTEKKSWEDVATVDAETLKTVSADEIERVKGEMKEDLKEIDDDLDGLLREGPKSEYFDKVARHLDGAVALAELHEKKGAGSIPPANLEKYVSDDCKPEAFKDQSCDDNFKRAIGCLKEAVEGIEKTLDSDAPVEAKVAVTKGVVGMVAKARGPLGKLAKACMGGKKKEERSWEDVALVDSETLKTVSKEEIEQVKEEMKGDLAEIDSDLDNLLKEGPESPYFGKVAGHLDDAVALAELHEKHGAGSIPPANLEKYVDDNCKPEAFKDQSCDDNFKRAIGCLKDAVEGIKKTLDSDAPVEAKVAVTKGVVGMVAKARGPLGKLAKACMGGKKKEERSWEDVALVDSETLKTVSKEEIERVKAEMKDDLAEIDSDLDNLLKEGPKSQYFDKVARHLDDAVALAELHEKHGAGSIPPADLEKYVDVKCKPEAFKDESCDDNFKRAIGCLKDAVEGIEKTLDSDAPVEAKVAVTKGVVGMVAKARGPLGKLAKACMGGKKKEERSWEDVALVDSETLKTVSKEDIERVKGEMKDDLAEIDSDLDNLLKEGPESQYFDKVARHLDDAVALAELHEKHGAGSIPPADLEKYVDDKCKPEAFKDESCDDNFKRAIGCLKDAVEGIEKTLDSDAPVEVKVSVTKGVVGMVAKARGPLGELAEACMGGKKPAKKSWEDVALIDAATLNSLSKDEIAEVADEMKDDLDEVDGDLDNLLKDGPDSPYFDKVAGHLDSAVALVELHAKKGAGSIPPADLKKYIPKECKPEAFKDKTCESNFKRAIGCLKKAVEGVRETLDSDASAVEKVSITKGVVGMVAEARAPLGQLADACLSKKRSFLSKLNAYLSK